jgi:mono/diheme cytochrome c family protein
MKRLVLEGLVAANLVVGFSVQSWAQQPMPQQADIGKAEYQSSCAACHGADGKGKGPVSGVLKSTPPDLTVLAKKNNGVFPINAVYEMIDGRKAVEAHGTREMPIWGFRYMPSPYEAVYPSPATEAAIRVRILVIIDYLNRIQEK